MNKVAVYNKDTKAFYYPECISNIDFNRSLITLKVLQKESNLVEVKVEDLNKFELVKAYVDKYNIITNKKEGVALELLDETVEFTSVYFSNEPKWVFKKVKSSNVEAVAYDLASQLLRIKFKGNSLYEYSSVPYDIYDQLMCSESVGKYLSKNIKGIYEVKRIS